MRASSVSGEQKLEVHDNKVPTCSKSGAEAGQCPQGAANRICGPYGRAKQVVILSDLGAHYPSGADGAIRGHTSWYGRMPSRALARKAAITVLVV